jgi:hypothetical protein
MSLKTGRDPFMECDSRTHHTGTLMPEGMPAAQLDHTELGIVEGLLVGSPLARPTPAAATALVREIGGVRHEAPSVRHRVIQSSL